MKKLKIFAGMIMILLAVTACGLGPASSKTQAVQANTGSQAASASPSDTSVAMPHTVCGVADRISGAVIMVTASPRGRSFCDWDVSTMTTGDWYVLSNTNSQNLHAPISCVMTSPDASTTFVVFNGGPQVYGAVCTNLILGGWQTNDSVQAVWATFEAGCPASGCPKAPPAPSPVNTSPALLLTCQLEYNVPANHPVGSNGIKNQSGWITPGYAGETDWTGGFTASPPAGWQPGVHIVSTQVYPWSTPQPAAGYSVTITLTNAAGSTVYTTSKTVRVTSSEMEAYNPIAGDGVLARDVPIGSNAAGADKCSAVVN